RDHGQSVGEVRAPRARRVADVAKRIRRLAEIAGPTSHRGAERIGGWRGQGEQLQWPSWPTWRGFGPRWRGLQDHVRVGAAEAEGTDARATRWRCGVVARRPLFS